MVAWLQTRTVNCWIKLQDNASMFHDNDMQLDSACRTNKLQSQHCLQKHQCMSLIQVAKRCDEGVQVSYFLSLRHVRDSVFTANMSYSFSLWFHCLSVENKLQKLWRQSRIWAFDFWIDVNCQHLSFHDSLHEILDVRWTANAYSFSIDAKGEVLELGTRGASAMPSFRSLAHATAQAVAQRQGWFQQPLGNLVLHRLARRK